jgi:serine/threonine protein kinase/chemotaxis signal transduction protein
MKLCQTCHIITTDEQNFCAHDGRLLVADPLATALQESVGSKYAVSRLIGTGSMGAVYRAQHHALGDVAIKVMLGPPDNHKLSERFLREAKALRKLNNQHAVLVYDLERSAAGLTYMVMEMVEGRSLRDELKARAHLQLEESIEIAEAVCDALSAAHERGIIHRDLKPDNILLAEEEDEADDEARRLIKIVDFGIVKLRGTQQGRDDDEASMQLTKHGTPIGTPFYMSPEQWFGDGPGYTALDGRTDIYALGCTLYETLSGYPPFLGETKEEIRRKHLNEPPRPLDELTAHVPEAVSRVILRALEKDRDFRPASAAEFAAEIRRAFEESAGSATEEKEEEKRSSPLATKAPGKDAERPTAEQMSQLQTTEEDVPLIRSWAAEEAQQVIEQMRERPPAAAQNGERQPSWQAVAEQSSAHMPADPSAELDDLETTLEPGRFRYEAERITLGKPDVKSFESEFQRTLLFQRDSASTLEKQGAAAGASASTIIAAGDESSRTASELILAQAGAWHIGLLSQEVESVSEWSPPAPLPHAPPAIMGVVSVRGRMLTVIDPAVLLGVGKAEKTGTLPAFIIALRGDEQLALAVNSVSGSTGIQATEMEMPSQAAESNILRGVIQGAHGQTLVLDARELFAAAMQGAERRRQRT